MRYSQRDKPPRAVFDSSFLANDRSILEDRLPPRFLPREREREGQYLSKTEEEEEEERSGEGKKVVEIS